MFPTAVIVLMWMMTAALLNLPLAGAVSFCHARGQDQDPNLPGSCSDVTIVTITSSPTKPINAQDKVAFTASVSAISSCTAHWSVNDTSVNVLGNALTPVRLDIVVGATQAANLVLPAFSLPARASLVFTLTCGESSAAITVTTNGPPLPGVFTIAPSSGVELSTSFLFSAFLWSDEDLPLIYQFGFESSTGKLTPTVLHEFKSSNVTHVLPAGPDTAAHTLTCFVMVFDALDGVSYAYSAATVRPLKDRAQRHVRLEAMLKASGENVDALRSTIAIGAAVLSVVSCAAAPACVPLNRASCAKMQNTCGPCLDGYMGDRGDQNSQCIRAPHTAKAVGSSCTATSECDQFLTCSLHRASPVCVLSRKRCPHNCSGHGSCTARKKIDQKRITACAVGDPSCEMSCVCTANYYGPNCGLTKSELAAKLSVSK